MKILVTGGAGYIGSVLVPQLLHPGHLVTVVDNFMYNQSPLLDYCYSSNLEIIRGDVSDCDFLKKILPRDYELIIPLACLTGAPLCGYNPRYAEAVIVDSIYNLTKLAHSDTKIIYPTTNSGYGVGTSEYCTEESPLNPISLYGKLKCEAEQIVLSRGNAVTLRLATAFGLSPRMRLDLLVNDLVYKAYHDRALVIFEGHFRRNFIHVLDIARAFKHCIANWNTMRGETYNVGNTKLNMTKMELAQKIANYINDLTIIESGTGEDPDKRDYLVSNEKLEKTGWSPVMDLDDGIRELIKGYQILKRNQYANI